MSSCCRAAYGLSERTAVGQDTEATEQLDAKRSPTSHSPILSQTPKRQAQD